MSIWTWIFGNRLPLWAYGVECHICNATFESPQAHYEHVNNSRADIKRTHIGKIPRLNK